WKMKPNRHFLITICFAVLMVGIFITGASGGKKAQNQNVIYIIADTGNRAFRIWQKEFLSARDHYYEKIPSVYYRSSMEKLVYIFDLDAYSRQERDYVRYVQASLGLSEGEPFIGVINVPWVKREEGWGPGDIGKAQVMARLSSFRPGYEIAKGEVVKNFDPEIIRKIAKEDYRYLLREMMKYE
ncbi:MAG: hypothetical protein J7M18_03410, partial [Candidatus Eremiobacteraeota bacterium]|nr:hypothetical protein [Candidatus Eremiobacteraeota bacterium]